MDYNLGKNITWDIIDCDDEDDDEFHNWDGTHMGIINLRNKQNIIWKEWK